MSNLERYINYLGRMQRIKKKSLRELHQYYISRDVAREYGLTEEEIHELDESLAGRTEKGVRDGNIKLHDNDR